MGAQSNITMGIGYSGPPSPMHAPLIQREYSSSPICVHPIPGAMMDPRSPMPNRAPMPFMHPNAPFDPRSPMAAHIGVRSPMGIGRPRLAPGAPFDPRSPMPTQMGARSPVPTYFHPFDPRSPMMNRSPIRGFDKQQVLRSPNLVIREVPVSPVAFNCFRSPIKGFNRRHQEMSSPSNVLSPCGPSISIPTVGMVKSPYHSARRHSALTLHEENEQCSSPS